LGEPFIVIVPHVPATLLEEQLYIDDKLCEQCCRFESGVDQRFQVTPGRHNVRIEVAGPNSSQVNSVEVEVAVQRGLPVHLEYNYGPEKSFLQELTSTPSTTIGG
jgi:hypothetical protein